MRTQIVFNERILLPNRNELIIYMWKDMLDITNIILFGNDLKDSEIIILGWNKWIDDERWNNSDKYREYIEIVIYNNKETLVITNNNIFDQYKMNNYNFTMNITMNDDAVCVDRRAYHRCVYFIAQKTGGLISLDFKEWMNVDEYYKMYKDIIDMPYEEAYEISLKEANLI